MMPKIKEFWITNISKLDVSIPDLNIRIRSFSSVNILDVRHYKLTQEQINNSKKYGDLGKKEKSGQIKIRLRSPDKQNQIIKLSDNSFLVKNRSGIETIKPQYDELEISDEVFAEELSETAEIDRAPKHSR